MDLSEIFSDLGGSLLKRFQMVLTSVSTSFISFPSIYSYLVGTSVLTSPVAYAGGISVFYRYLFPFLTNLVTKIYQEFANSLHGDLVNLAFKPLKLASNL